MTLKSERNTRKEAIEPKAMAWKRPKYESERKAPKRGMKLEAADQKKSRLVPWANPILYSLIK
jgi:hypothetical protein